MRRLWLLVVLVCGVTAPAVAQTIYVDANISPSSCTTYTVATRVCGSGSDTAYKTVSGATAVATAGMTVRFRAGTYSNQQLSVTASGSSGSPITFQAYPGETPTITGVSGTYALGLISRDWIVVDGLTFTNSLGWARLEGADNNIIRNNTFTTATSTGTTGGFKLHQATRNTILNNTFDDGNDNLLLQDASDRNVIEGNTFTTARHSLLSIRCAEYNVIRDNDFANTDQKGTEIFDCEGVSDAPVRLDSTERNLWEANRFTATLSSGQPHDYNAIQHGGQRTIVRRNVFRDNLGGAINYQEYADESLYVYGNRAYQNTFADNRCFAIVGNAGSNYSDNRVQNNIFFRNLNCAGAAGQTQIENGSVVILTNNLSVTSDPGFANEAGFDYTLTAGSAAIDAGTALTTTSGSGSGTSMTVADVKYFYDGYGISGEVGDTIQLHGTTQTAVITAIDLGTNVLTLGSSLTWTSGQGVSLAYTGGAPDQGAFEFGEPVSPPVFVIRFRFRVADLGLGLGVLACVGRLNSRRRRY